MGSEKASGDEAKQIIQEFIDELTEDYPNVRFERLKTVCTKVFGEHRQSGSHVIFSTGMEDNSRLVLVEADGGESKNYQIKQVIEALNERIEYINQN